LNKLKNITPFLLLIIVLFSALVYYFTAQKIATQNKLWAEWQKKQRIK
jgi:hypothetical protein